MNDNQFGFRPQKSTVDAAMVIKAFVQESLDAVEVIALLAWTFKKRSMQRGGQGSREN
jgi:hypothetical protein